MNALRIVDIAPPERSSREIAAVYEKVAPALGVRPPTRAEAVAWIEALERFYADPLPARLTERLRDAIAAPVTAAEWRESIGGTEVVIDALRQGEAAIDGPMARAAERIVTLVHPDLAARTRRARDDAHARVAQRIAAVEHLRDRVLVRIAQLEGRTDESAVERLRRSALDALERADAKQSPISDDDAAALV